MFFLPQLFKLGLLIFVVFVMCEVRTAHIVSLALVLIPSFLSARPTLPARVSDIPYIECFKKAAYNYKVELPLLVAVAEKESGFNPKALNRDNKNGSFDIGIMQINSWWIKVPYEKNHFYEPCFNISFGAFVMADSLKSWGYNWYGVGKYNASTPSKGYVYSQELYPIYVKYVRIFSHEKNKK